MGSCPSPRSPSSTARSCPPTRRRSASPTSGCCAATASSRWSRSTTAGRSRSTTTCAGWRPRPQNLRLEIDLSAVRADIDALLAEQPGPVTGALRFLVTRGGRRIGLVEPLAGAARRSRSRPSSTSPPRILDGVKSLSYAREHARDAARRGARRRRGAARHAARPRAGGADLVVLRVLGRRDAGDAAAERPRPGLDHAPAVVVALAARARGGRHARRARAARARRSWPRRRARSSRSRAIDDVALPGAPGPLTAAAAAGVRRARRRRAARRLL